MQCSNASPLWCIVAKPILVGDFVGDPGLTTGLEPDVKLLHNISSIE